MKTAGSWLIPIGALLFVAGLVVLYRLRYVDVWASAAGLAMVGAGGWLRWGWRGAAAAPFATIVGFALLVIMVNLGARFSSDLSDGPSSTSGIVTPTTR